MGSVSEDLLNEPKRALDLPRDEAIDLLARVGVLAEMLRIRATQPEAVAASTNGDLIIISLDEAARRVSMARRQFLRCPAFKLAIVKLGHRTRGVDERTLQSIIATRRS
jgi:hypothetical protein